MIDSGCSTVFINEKIVPATEDIIEDLENSFYSYTSTQQRIWTTSRLKHRIKLRFMTHCGQYSNSYNCPHGPNYVWVRPDIGEDFLLGTSFIFGQTGGMFIAQNFVCLFKNTVFSPIYGNQVPNPAQYL